MKRSMVYTTMAMVCLLIVGGFASMRVAGASVSESEPNDDIDSATPINLGDTVSGEISTTSDIDFFAFSVTTTAGQSVKVEATLTFDASHDLDLWILDKDEVTLGSSAGYDVPEVAVAVIDVSGTYYIAVQGYYDTGTYTLTTTSSTVLTSDGNNQPETAETATSGQTKSDTLNTENDPADFYKITLNYNPPNVDKLTVNLTITQPENTFGVLIYSSYKELLTYGAVGGYYGLSTEVSVKSNTTGDYYVAVKTYEGNGTYTLKFTVTQVTTDGNDDFDYAEEKQSGDVVNSDLDPANDDTADYYKIQLNGEGTMVDKLTVNLTVPTQDPSLSLTLYDPDRKYIDSAYTNSYYSNTGPSVELRTIATKSGYYYVRVSSTSDTTTYTLKFTVTQVASDGNNDFSQAVEVHDGDKVTNTVHYENDPNDYYKINLTVNGNVHDRLTANLTVTDNTTQFTVYIYDDPEGYPLTSATTNGYYPATGESVEVSTMAQATGYYYVVVYANDGSSGSYTLSFTVAQVTPDNNNEKENATTLGPNDQHTEDIDEAGDKVDWYKVTVTGASQTSKKLLSVRLDEPSGVDFDLYIYDDQDNKLDYSWYDDPHESVSVVVDTSPATYYVKVEAYSGSGTYTITTTTEEVVEDGNNDFDNATEVQDGQTITDSLNDVYDEYDYFKIDLSATATTGDLLTVNLTVNSDTADVTLVLYNTTMDRVKSISTNGYETGPSVELSMGAKESGYHYISLRIYSGSVDYTMKISVSTYTRDGNDDIDNATDLGTLPNSTTGSIDPDLDTSDFYKVHLSPSTHYNKKKMLVVNLTRSDGTRATASGLTMYVTIYDPDKNDIGSMTLSSSETSDEVMAPVTEEGDYYIEIEASTYGSGQGDYILSLRAEMVEDDHNDDFNNATVVFMGETHQGHVNAQYDENDFYRIALTPGNVLDVTLSFSDTSGKGTYYGKIYPPGAEDLYDYVDYNSTYSYPDGTITLHHEANESGYYYIRVHTYTGDSDYTMTISGSGNHPAEVELTSPENGAIVHGESVTLEWSGSDADSDSITYDVYIGPSIYSMVRVRHSHPTTKYVYSEVEDGKTYYWTVIPNDGKSDGRCLSGVWNFTMRFNEPPVLNSISPTTSTVELEKGESTTFSVNATDPEGAELTYKWYLDDDLIEGAEGRNYTFNATYDMGGNTYTLKVVISDGKVSVEHQWSIDVKATNAPPKVIVETTPSDLGNLTIYDTVTLDASKTEDEEPQSLSFIWTLDGAQKGTESTMTLTGLAPGTHTVGLTVVDSSTNQATWSAEMVVKAPTLDIDVTLPEGKIETGKEYTITVTVKNTGDIDAKDINVELDAEGESIGTQTIAYLAPGMTQTLEFTWTPDKGGSYHITAKATWAGAGAEQPVEVGTSEPEQGEPPTLDVSQAKTTGSGGGGDLTVIIVLVVVIIIIVVALVVLMLMKKKGKATPTESTPISGEETLYTGSMENEPR